VYRFRHDGRPLEETEGAFLFCGFVVALAAQQLGRPVEARAWFERNRAACGSPGLLTEEFDVGERQLRGNFPLAFVHALLAEAAARVGPDSSPMCPTREFGARAQPLGTLAGALAARGRAASTVGSAPSTP